MLLKSLATALLFRPLLVVPVGARGALTQTTDQESFLKEKKMAIVIGISDYPAEGGFPKLQYAAKDAEDLASALEKQGYQTQLLHNQHEMKSSIRKALRQAQDLLKQGAVGENGQGTILFAFPGDGGQKGNGLNARQYLVTVDSSSDEPPVAHTSRRFLLRCMRPLEVRTRGAILRGQL